MINEIEKSQAQGENKATINKEAAKRILENLKTYTEYNFNKGSFSFKEKLLLENEDKENSLSYSETDILDPSSLDFPKSQKIKLSEIKEEMKNEYAEFLYNQTTLLMPNLEEIEPFYQIGVDQRTIYPKYKKHIHNLIRLNEILDQFPLNTPKGSVDVSAPVKTVTKNIKTSITKEIAPGVKFTMQFKEKPNEVVKNITPPPSQKKKIATQEKFRFKSRESMQFTCKDHDFADRSFQMLTGDNYNKNDHNNNHNENGNNYNKQEHNSNQNNNYNKPEDSNHSNNYNDNTQKVNPNYNDDDVKQHIINNAHNSNDIQSLMNNRNIKVLFPEEIHTTYQVDKKGTKTIEINQNSNLYFNY
jgi:hypothetical protein